MDARVDLDDGSWHEAQGEPVQCDPGLRPRTKTCAEKSEPVGGLGQASFIYSACQMCSGSSHVAGVCPLMALFCWSYPKWIRRMWKFSGWQDAGSLRGSVVPLTRRCLLLV